MIDFIPNPKIQKYINYLSIPFYLHSVITIFGRTFNGLFISSFRLGELIGYILVVF